MAPSPIFPIKVARIAAVNPIHHRQQLSSRRLQNQVLVVSHKNTTVDQNPVTIMVGLKNLKKFDSVRIF